MNISTEMNLDIKLTGRDNLEQMVHKLRDLDSADLLAMAKNLLDNFILANFAGWVDKHSSWDDVDDEKINDYLSFGCNSPYKFARLKSYLWLAKLILIDNRSRIDDGFEKNRLTCRLVLLWQYLLAEPAFQLKRILTNELDDISHDSEPKEEVAESLLERMYAYLIYNEISKAESCLKNAMAILNFEIETVGILGKRTRFQEDFIPQLIAKTAGGEEQLDENAVGDESDLPVNVLLRDDSLLETICFAKTDTSLSRVKLSSISLACILALIAFERKFQSSNDDTVVEKCCSYLDEVISQRSNWAAQTSALIQRCKFEKTRVRRVERACMQMEALSKLISGINTEKISHRFLRKRLKFLLACGLEPFWYVDALYAEILCSTGCTAEALAIYEKQENWNSVIECYQSLGQLEKAERLVRDLIRTNENEPTYWCLLGDILNVPSAYEKAIEVSKGRSFRAQRSLGMLMLQRKHYDISYQYLERSLELQPINASTWFNLGCCAWKLNKWEEAARAFRECVRYEPAYYQAWNNLAAVYEKLNDPEKAKRLLQEALKLNFEHLKLRENYILLCMRTHDISSALSTFHVLLDLNKQYKDDAIIEELTQKLIMLRQNNEDSTKHLITRMCELLGRITSQQTCSATVWRCYAELKQPSSKSSQEEYEIYMKLLERAFRATYSKMDWYKNEDSCIIVLGDVVKLIEAKKIWLEMRNVENAVIESEIRMILRPLIACIEKTYGAEAAEASSNRLKECLTKVKLLLSVSSSILE